MQRRLLRTEVALSRFAVPPWTQAQARFRGTVTLVMKKSACISKDAMGTDSASQWAMGVHRDSFI